MKLGLITDIHEHLEYLRIALGRFHQENVDQVVVIGDVFEMGIRIEETCRLLAEAKAIGVWGNHDFGLCRDLDDGIRARYSGTVLDFTTSLQARLELAGCLFTHVEPWLNPQVLTDLWYYHGPADEHRNLQRIFAAASNRLMFAGHFHKWLLATPEEIRPWRAEGPIHLSEGRYFVVVGPLCEGWFATFDTDTSELTPFCGG